MVLDSDRTAHNSWRGCRLNLWAIILSLQTAEAQTNQSAASRHVKRLAWGLRDTAGRHIQGFSGGIPGSTAQPKAMAERTHARSPPLLLHPRQANCPLPRGPRAGMADRRARARIARARRGACQPGRASRITHKPAFTHRVDDVTDHDDWLAPLESVCVDVLLPHARGQVQCAVARQAVRARHCQGPRLQARARQVRLRRRAVQPRRYWRCPDACCPAGQHLPAPYPGAAGTPPHAVDRTRHPRAVERGRSRGCQLTGRTDDAQQLAADDGPCAADAHPLGLLAGHVRLPDATTLAYRLRPCRVRPAIGPATRKSPFPFTPISVLTARFVCVLVAPRICGVSRIAASPFTTAGADAVLARCAVLHRPARVHGLTRARAVPTRRAVVRSLLNPRPASLHCIRLRRLATTRLITRRLRQWTLTAFR